MHWMDLLRGTAVLLVVFLHAAITQGFDDTPTPVWWINSAVEPYRLPLLVFASGLILHRSLSRPGGEFTARKARTLLWPWLIWTAVVVATPLYGGVGVLWWIGGTHTWFLTALFLLYMTALISKKIHPLAVALVFAIALSAARFAPQGDGLLAAYTTDLLRLGIFFFLGAGLRHYVIDRQMPARLIAVLAAVAAVWAAYSVTTNGPPDWPLIGPAISTAGILALCWIAQLVPRTAAARLVEWFGKHSIVVYVVHWPVQLMLGYIAPDLDGWLGLAIRFVIGVGIAAAMIAIRPWTTWLYALPARSRDRQLVA